MLTTFAHTSALFFAFATLLYLGSFISKRKKLWSLAQGALLLGLGVQALGFALHFAKVGFPLLQQADEAFLFSGWILAFLYLVLSLKYHLPWLGLFFMPAVLVLYSLSHFSNEHYAQNVLLFHSPWASIHIVFSFLAFSLFSLTFLMGLLFLLQEYQLKSKRNFLELEKMPSLELLDLLHFKALRLGFIFLTLGILSGSAWAKTVKGLYFFNDPRQLWTLVAWLVYLLFLQVHVRANWRGRRGVLLSLLGFVVILFTFLEVRHS
ncbi:MAG: cytochrome c biogenesis protein CcsA [Deltaproteobacteria bacterium]|nr:cytochrome c biogenesis protein CcsA [Deltaproteobacteria bacterium]